MESSEKDCSSIQPVSSLRSHFESLTTSKSASNVPTLRKQAAILPNFDTERQANFTGGRGSLDTLRAPSPWENLGESTRRQRTGQFPESPLLTRHGSSSSLQFHPTSAGPSPPTKAPRISKSPYSRSPPKSTSISKSPTRGDLPASAPLTPLIRGVKPAAKAPMTFTDHASGELLASLQPSLQRRGESPKLSSTSSGRIAPAPPPVNRADKPKPQSKPPPIVSHTGKASLDPGEAVQTDRVSPFSTPPSSEEKLSVDVRGNQSTDVLRPAAIETIHHHDYFRTPPRQSSEGQRPSTRDMAVPEKRQADPRASGFTRTIPQPGDLPSDRPGLPPRPDNERQSISPDSAQDGGNDFRAPKLGSRVSKQQQQQHMLRVDSKPLLHSTGGFLPPPKRANMNNGSLTVASTSRASNDMVRPVPPPSRGVGDQHLHSYTQRNEFGHNVDSYSSLPESISLSASDYPDFSQANRRPPRVHEGVHILETKYDTRLFDANGRYVCATGYLTKAWDVISGEEVLNLGHDSKEVKVTALAFKPGATAEEEGLRIWLGTNYGEIQEIDIAHQSIIHIKSNAHARREVIKLYRHQNSMWSLDDDGKLLVWSAENRDLPSLEFTPTSHRVPKGHTFSIVIKDYLWLAIGKEIKIFNPGADGEESFHILQSPLSQAGVGEVTSGAAVSDQLDRVYFGHNDGKVTIYSTSDYQCLGIVNVSVYKINSLAGAGFYLWAGYNTGMIYVYDTRTRPWLVKKDWQAHENPVAGILVDRSSVWKLGHLRVVSIGLDNTIRMWDGMLQDDWLEADMQEHDAEYCEFRELKAVVVTWNAGATTPTSLRYEDRNNNFFREVIQIDSPPDILVFGFQELVDLDDKRLTAKSLFKGNKKKDSSEQEHMSHQYRDWRDHLVRALEDNMPTKNSYHLVHTASMVGLFTCVFVKSSERTHIRNLHAVEVKRGIGGLHGNKGALIMRFVLDDTSLCFTNCHLAAGQSQTINRNNDITAILETSALPMEQDSVIRMGTFRGGGDGSMIMDHEICVLNGDLNYRIDTMGRDTVIKAVKANNLAKLLERDQLLVSRRRNPGFKLRSFTEFPINFAPTYKYDIGTDRYDSSEKNRSPAWCDRLLYKGAGRVKQLNYQRHELRISDHRPVSGTFKMRIKRISPEKQSVTWDQCIARFTRVKQMLAKKAEVDYLVSVLGLDPREAQGLVGT